MILAFTGKAGSGKSTCAQLVVDHAPKGWKVERFSFAAALKQAASLIFAPTLGAEGNGRGAFARPSAFYGTQAQKEMPREELGGRSGRELLQELGSLARGFNEDVFLNHLRRSAPRTIQVIDDLRYPNEAQAVHRLGGRVIGIQVFDEPFEAEGHASEAELVTHWLEMTDVRWSVGRGALDTLTRLVQEELRRPL
jgi:hypothetical protein